MALISQDSLPHFPSVCFREVTVRFLPIFKLGCFFPPHLSFGSYFYILAVSPLSDRWLANIPPHLCACLFLLSAVSSEELKPQILILVASN